MFERIDKKFAIIASDILQELGSSDEKNVLSSLPLDLMQDGILATVVRLENLGNSKLLKLIQRKTEHGFDKLTKENLLNNLSDSDRFLLERKLAILFVWLKRLHAAEKSSGTPDTGSADNAPSFAQETVADENAGNAAAEPGGDH